MWLVFLIELLLLFIGILVLCYGKVRLWPTREVRGGPAYAIGTVLIAALPTTILSQGIIAFVLLTEGRIRNQRNFVTNFDPSAIWLELGIMLALVLPCLLVTLFNLRDPATAEVNVPVQRSSSYDDDFDDFDANDGYDDDGFDDDDYAPRRRRRRRYRDDFDDDY